MIEGVATGYVVHQQRAGRSAIVRPRDGSKSLLTGGVPYLKFDRFRVDGHQTRTELDAWNQRALKYYRAERECCVKMCAIDISNNRWSGRGRAGISCPWTATGDTTCPLLKHMSVVKIRTSPQSKIRSTNLCLRWWCTWTDTRKTWRWSGLLKTKENRATIEHRRGRARHLLFGYVVGKKSINLNHERNNDTSGIPPEFCRRVRRNNSGLLCEFFSFFTMFVRCL